MLVRFTRRLGWVNLLCPIDGARAHRAVQTREGSKVDSSAGTFVHAIHHPMVAQRGRHRRPSVNGFRRLVALSGPPGSHVHTDSMGTGSHTATQPTTVIPSTPPRVLRLALPNSATTRPMASSSHRLQGFLQMSAHVRSIRDVAQRSFSGAAWPGSGITQLAVGPLRRRHRRPPFPVLMHKSTTIPGHGVCRGQGLLVASSCPLTAGLGRQFGSGE